MIKTKRPCLLFDLDGTLTDTDHLHFMAMNRILAPSGIVLDQAAFRTKVVGRPNNQIFADFFPALGKAEHEQLADQKEAWAREGMRQGLTRLAGLTTLLAWIKDRNLPAGIVTNAPRANAETMLAGLDLVSAFDTLVIGDELEHAKPHPLPYLTGLARLGGDPHHCVAFEDSLSGAGSAIAAGIATVGMTTSHQASELAGIGAALTVADFSDPALLPFITARLGL
jgi:HAD superfamily hydrolase (TIGR01509 family)